MGLMQLMPTTASIYHLNDNHFNPRNNISAGVQHVKMLMGKYKGDKKISLAAYNAGEGAVKKYGGIPPYEETTRYVKKVLQLYKMYKKEI